MSDMVDTNKKLCRTCAYHQMMTSMTVCCMYMMATKEPRGKSFGKAEIGKCDKYVFATRKEHDDFWRMINNLENNPNKPNAFTINSRRYDKKNLEEYKGKGKK